MMPVLALLLVPAFTAIPVPRPAAPKPAAPKPAGPRSVAKPVPASAVRILAPGTYARTEVAKDAAGVWWGLVKEGEAFSLRPLKVKATPLSLDEARPKVMDGVEIGTAEDAEAVLLVRGLKLQAGPVPAAIDLRLEGNEAGAQKVTGAFQGEPFELWSESMGEGSAKAILRLRMGSQTHAVLLLEDCEDCTWDLLWAGDLDGDGRLDLLVGTTHLENKGLMRLFLSGKAKAPALAATHAWDFGD